MTDAATALAPAIASTREPEKQEKPKILPAGNFASAEFARARFDAVMPAGWPFEEALKPGFWAYVVGQFARNIVTGQKDRAGAFIDLGTEDHSFYGKLYVRAVLERGLVVQCIGPARDPQTGQACPIDLQTGQPWTGAAPTILAADQFEVKWNPGKRGFDIIRRADQQIVADGREFKTREAASEWIAKVARAA